MTDLSPRQQRKVLVAEARCDLSRLVSRWSEAGLSSSEIRFLLVERLEEDLRRAMQHGHRRIPDEG